MHTFQIELAGLPIEVNSRNAYCRDFCSRFLSCAAAPVFSVYAEEWILAKLREKSEETNEAYLERDAIYCTIAAQLPKYQRLLMHGACISYQNKGILFTAPSGTGKTTHIQLWKRYIGTALGIVNGDKPILSVDMEQGIVMAHGTPWRGKEAWGSSSSAQLAAICVLSRAEPGQNRFSALPPEQAVEILLRQIYHPWDEAATIKLLELADCILTHVPFYLLECDMSEEAVRCSFEGLTAEPYPSRGIQLTDQEINKQWRL